MQYSQDAVETASTDQWQGFAPAKGNRQKGPKPLVPGKKASMPMPKRHSQYPTIPMPKRHSQYPKKADKPQRQSSPSDTFPPSKDPAQSTPSDDHPPGISSDDVDFAHMDQSSDVHPPPNLTPPPATEPNTDMSKFREDPATVEPSPESDLLRPDAPASKGGGESPQVDSDNEVDSASEGDPCEEDVASDTSDVSDGTFDKQVQEEIQRSWVLTLSMKYRDGTQREKFFITYMRSSNDWVHVTVSVDYGKCEEGSLEADLRHLGYQRDKNLFIYKAVRQSLTEILFFETITNLRLETEDEQLHIHVAEDTHEIIPYPPLYNLNHLGLKFHSYLQVREEDVNFESHLSGFVYKVQVFGQIYVKKEIPSTDNVQEFLYEIEALADLRQSKSVINLAGIVVATTNDIECVTGVLLEYASGGALNDFFYEHEKDDLDWDTRMTWIRQVVQGMADIHELGYVQGDCTLSNVVLDCDGNAKVVDINRRGCPIGWEPPEFRGKIQSGQRISMFIGFKSDLYQLGMVLWAIAMQVEEPDRADRPLILDDPDTPPELAAVIESCLSDDRLERKMATELLSMLPQVKPMPKLPVFKPKQEPIMTMKELSTAVTHEDVGNALDQDMDDVEPLKRTSGSSDGLFDEKDDQLETDDFALGLFHQDSGFGFDPTESLISRAILPTKTKPDVVMAGDDEEGVHRVFNLPHADSGFDDGTLKRLGTDPAH